MRSETIAFVVVIVVVLLVVGFVGVMFLWVVGAVVTPRPSLRVPALIVGLVLVITGIGVVAALLNPSTSTAPGPTVTVSGSGAVSSGHDHAVRRLLVQMVGSTANGRELLPRP